MSRNLIFHPLLRGLQALSILPLLLALAPVRAESKPPRANYRQAVKYSAANLAPLTYSTAVIPGWIGKTDSFWYAYRTSKGTAYWRVDPVRKTKAPLFDREKLGSQLSELSSRAVDSALLPITRAQVTADGRRFSFVFAGILYEYDLKAEKLVSRGKAPAAPRFGRPWGGFRRRAAEDAGPQVKEKGDKKGKEKRVESTRRGGPSGRRRITRVVSPDRRSVLFIRAHNLYLGAVGKEKVAVQLTRDGAEDYGFLLFGGFGPAMTNRPRLARSAWSRDSRHFYAYRLDSRGVKELFVINSLAAPRPTLERYKYAMPGEEAIRKTELYFGSRTAKGITRVKARWRDESYSNLHWGNDPRELRFLRHDRLHRNLELCALHTGTGHCKVLLREGFENAPVSYQAPHYLESTNEMIWWSERTGWGHFYLYDRQGKRKNAITSGPWRASRIVAVDQGKRVLYFQGNAREKGENAYYEHLYSVKLDGTGLTLLDPGNAHHYSMLSPSRRFLVDNLSRIDECPESVLRDSAGKKIMDLEKADLSRLKERGWRPPETFVVKAGDGVTDLYGNLYKPFDFDPKKRYPIIANVYPGPQTEGMTHTFGVYNSNMQLAQLGFIVIQVGHRGGSPLRSKAYASYGYFNLRDYGLADKKTAIEQLAARYKWIDVKKVGIFGHSGGGFMSAAALLQKPYNEFFKAGVASAGNHDNNIYGHTWAERYHGMKEVVLKEVKDKTKGPAPAAPPAKRRKKASSPPAKTPAAPPPKTKFAIKVPTNAELAVNLKGRLLLVHGEIDNNVHPANTMRLVDALIKANKRFDMLILPGKRHGFGDYTPYFTRRMWEFFAEHLLGDRRSGADIRDEDDD
jgi:dipeptidyl aminopeptidase/acylaminoacyl peptidase